MVAGWWIFMIHNHDSEYLQNESRRDGISDSNQQLHNDLSPVGTAFQIANRQPHKGQSPIGTTFQIANTDLTNIKLS